MAFSSEKKKIVHPHLLPWLPSHQSSLHQMPALVRSKLIKTYSLYDKLWSFPMMSLTEGTMIPVWAPLIISCHIYLGYLPDKTMTKDSQSAGTQSTPTIGQDLDPVPSSWNEHLPGSPRVHSLTKEIHQQIFPLERIKCYLSQKQMPDDWLSEEADSTGKGAHKIIKRKCFERIQTYPKSCILP